MIENGTRVVAYAGAGGGFAGKGGTVVNRVGHFYHVDFDHTGHPGDPNLNGGTWSESSLHVLTGETIDRLRDDLVEADAEIARLGDYARAREAEIADQQGAYTSLADYARAREAEVETLKADLTEANLVLDYARSLLSEPLRAQVKGFADAAPRRR